MSAETQAHHTPERPAVATRYLLWAAGGSLLLLVGAIVVLDFIYLSDVPVRTMPPPQTFPAPRLRVDEPAELQQLLAAQRARLGEFRWTDDTHQFVQIPIERAMHLIAQQGAGAYGPLTASNSALSSPLAGAERAITPAADPVPAADGNGAAGGTDRQTPTASDRQDTPQQQAHPEPTPQEKRP